MGQQSIDAARVLEAAMRGSARTLDDLARDAGASADSVRPWVDRLIAEGWLIAWDAQGGVRYALTPWAAARLGVMLDDEGRWVPQHEHDTLPRQRRKRRTVSDALSVLARRIDPAQHQPWVALAAADEIALARSRGVYKGDHSADRLPYPTVLLGLSIPWDGPELTRERTVCRSCGGCRLPAHVYCLKCDNWGMQRLIPRDLRDSPQRPQSNSGRLEGGLGARGRRGPKS
jgi:hypothetical protein